MKLHLALLVAVLAASSAHTGGRLPISQDLDPQFYCGRKLARMLASLCHHSEKTSGSGSMLYPILAQYYRAQEQYMTSQKHKNQGPSEWPPHQSGARYAWPFKTETYGSLSHKIKDSEDWPLDKAKESQEWPWLTTNKNRALDLPSRDKRNLADECCETPCTIDELMTYC